MGRVGDDEDKLISAGVAVGLVGANFTVGQYLEANLALPCCNVNESIVFAKKAVCQIEAVDTYRDGADNARSIIS